MSDSSDVYFVLRAEGHVHLSDVRHVSSTECLLLTASRDQSAMIHPVVPFSDIIEAGVALRGHKAFVNFVLFHPGLALLSGEACVVTGGNDNHVALWNPISAALEAVLDGHSQGVCCGTIIMSAEPHSEGAGDIVTGDWGGLCLVFDSITGGVKQSYNGHKTAIRGIAQLPGTNSVVTASGDKTVHQWDIITGSTISVFNGHMDVVQCICSLSATRFASGGNDATIMIWDTEVGTAPLCVLKAHNSLIYSLSYCPSRRLLFSASEDQTVKVWQGGAVDVNTSNLRVKENSDAVVVQSIAHPCVVWSVCVTGAGDIATGGADGVLRLWTADDSKMASVEKLQAFEAVVAAQKIDVKVAGIAGLNIDSLVRVEDLHLCLGTREGEQLLARSGGGAIEVYHWNRGRWDKVGTVVEGVQKQDYSGRPQREKVYLNGTPHDYVFDVDANGVMLKLVYDRGQSLFDAAQHFINENSRVVSQSHREEIQSFIFNNIDPSDAQLLTGSGTQSLTMANLSAPGDNEPILSGASRDSAALRNSGVSHVPSLGEAMRNMENASVSMDNIAFSGYAREGLELQQQQAAQRASVNPSVPSDVNQSITMWDGYKIFTAFNAVGAQKKINELSGDDARFRDIVQRVQTAAMSTLPDKVLLEDIIALYHQLPDSSRFPAIDLLGYLLAVATLPFEWLLLLLLEEDAKGNDKAENSNGASADGGHSSLRAFMKERVGKLSQVSEVEALVTMRLFSHAVAALDKLPREVTLATGQVELLLTALTKAPHSFLRTTKSSLKTAISALMRNTAVLLSRNPSVFGEKGLSDATQGVVRLLSHWLVFESASSPHIRELVTTVLTLVLSESTATVAVALGRCTLSHTMRELKTCTDPCCREAATTIMHVLDDAEVC